MKKIKKVPKKSRTIKSGGVDKYVAACPKEVQGKLREMRAAIREVAPDSVETVSYFDMPLKGTPTLPQSVVYSRDVMEGIPWKLRDIDHHPASALGLSGPTHFA